MDQNTSLAVQPMPRSLLQMSDGQMNKLMLLADMISQSKLAIGKNGRETLTKADAFMILLKGISLGMNEMAALESIDLISGKPAIDAQGMLGLCYASGELENIVIDATDERCIVTMTRKGKSPHTEQFGVEEASKYMTSEWVSGQKREIPLIEKPNYKSQRRVMFKWRCVSACARVVFPDKTQGLLTKEELNTNVAVTEDGRMTVVDAPALPAPQPAPVQIPATVESQVVTPAATDPKGYLIGDLYNAVLKDVYNNVPKHMNNSIGLLIKEGKLTDDMTLEQAVAVVKDRKTADNMPVSKPPEVTAAQPGNIIPDEVPSPTVTTEQEHDAAYYADLETEQRRKSYTALENEAVTIFRVTYSATRNGMGAPFWNALAHDINGASVPVVVWGKQVNMVKKAGYEWPATDGDKLNIMVVLERVKDAWQIKSVVPKESPFGGKAEQTSQQLFENLPAQSAALAGQLDR